MNNYFIQSLMVIVILVNQGIYAQGAKILPAKLSTSQETMRKQWLSYMDKVARPVLSNLAADKLKAEMTVILSPTSDNPELRKQVAYLEAFARTLCGISPWLNIEGGSMEEITLRNQYREWALKHRLPSSLQPAQVRCALTAVIKKTHDAPDTFTKDGWLNIGLYGHQPALADFYITTGSLYLCMLIYLPLGLPADDPFWINPDIPWTAKKVWTGTDIPADHSYID